MAVSLINRSIDRALSRSDRHSGAAPYYQAALDFFEARYSPSYLQVLSIRLDPLESLSRAGELTPSHPRLAQDFDLENRPPGDQTRWHDVVQKHLAKDTVKANSKPANSL